LPISADYETFVREPTGVIQRHFGHPAFRVDLSAAVDGGHSWQLGLFVGHALMKSNRLGHPDSDVQLTVIATGEVNRDLFVLPVEHVAEKFDNIDARLQEIGADPNRTVLVVPKGNRDEVASQTTGSTVKVLAVGQVGELLDYIGISQDWTKANIVAAKGAELPADRSKTSRVMRLVVLLILLSIIGASWVSYSPHFRERATKWVQVLKNHDPGPSQAQVPAVDLMPKLPPFPIPAVNSEPKAKPIEPTVTKTERPRENPKEPISITILERRAPAGYNCRDVRSGRINAETATVSLTGSFAFGPSIVENLCTVDIEATGNEDGLYLFGRYQRWMKGRRGNGEPNKTIDLGPQRGSVRWSADISESFSQGALFEIVVFSSRNHFNVPNRLLDRIGTQPRSQEVSEAVKRLKRRGISMDAAQFRIVPKNRLRYQQERRNQERPQNSGSWTPSP
jgi:hypothetical protein